MNIYCPDSCLSCCNLRFDVQDGWYCYLFIDLLPSSSCPQFSDEG